MTRIKKHITEEQRHTIAKMLAEGANQITISQAIGKHKSVVCREIKRNSNPETGEYTFDIAQAQANRRREKKKRPYKLNEDLRMRIVGLLERNWSPGQIVETFKLLEMPCVCQQTIYKMLRIDRKRGGSLYNRYRSGRKRLKLNL